MTVLLVKTHHHSAITLVFRIARLTVVGADINPAARHDRSRVSFRADLRHPFNVLAGFWIERFGQAPFARYHVARPGLAPLRLIAAPSPDSAAQSCQGDDDRQTELFRNLFQLKKISEDRRNFARHAP